MFKGLELKVFQVNRIGYGTRGLGLRFRSQGVGHAHFGIGV